MANCASVMTTMLPIFCITSPSLAVADEHGKRHTVRALSEAVSDWLNPLSLGTMSASGYIANLA